VKCWKSQSKTAFGGKRRGSQKRKYKISCRGKGYEALPHGQKARTKRKRGRLQKRRETLEKDRRCCPGRKKGAARPTEKQHIDKKLDRQKERGDELDKRGRLMSKRVQERTSRRKNDFEEKPRPSPLEKKA